jgi:hypothetical protein
MKRLFTALVLTGLLGFTACTDQYGRPDPVATALIGAGVGAAAGLAIGAASQPRVRNHHYYRPAPRASYRRGYYQQPRYYHQPRGYYRQPRYHYRRW